MAEVFLAETSRPIPQPGFSGIENGIGAALLFSLLPTFILTLQAATPVICPVCPAQCSPTPICPDTFIKLSTGGMTIPNKCFFFSTDDIDFPGAIAKCAQLGGRLLNIETMEEGEAVRDHLRENFLDNDFTVGCGEILTGGPVVCLSGGPTNIPVFGNIPATTALQDCLLIRVVPPNIPETRFEPCNDPDDFICEINLGTNVRGFPG